MEPTLIEQMAKQILAGHTMPPKLYVELRASIVNALTVLHAEMKREFVRLQADPLEAVMSEEAVEVYINSLPWRGGTDDEKTLVACNLRSFAHRARLAAAAAKAEP